MGQERMRTVQEETRNELIFAVQQQLQTETNEIKENQSMFEQKVDHVKEKVAK